MKTASKHALECRILLTKFKKFPGGNTPGPPWQEGDTPSCTSPGTASPCVGALRAPSSADPVASGPLNQHCGHPYGPPSYRNLEPPLITSHNNIIKNSDVIAYKANLIQ